jgi:RNA polymerase sigma-70 factor (ECF subfamily)
VTAVETDQQLVARVQTGDSRAFDLLVLKYQHKIFSLIGRYVHDADEVQDVAQEAFIKAYRALPKFRGDSQFYTWLYRIAVNTAKNHLVSRSRRPPGSDVDVDDAEYYEGGAALRDIETR